MRLVSTGFPCAIMLALLVLCGCTGPSTVAGAGPGTPGWTGSMVIPGNNSTAAGDSEATYLAQKWPYGGRR